MAPSPRADSQSGSTWKCPRCGRAFAKRNQAHSCRSESVESHFDGKSPQLRRLFDHLVTTLRSAGPLRIDAVPSSINLVSRHHFGGIKVHRDHLRVGFLAASPIEGPQIVRRQVVGPSRIMHSVVLRTQGDLTARLLTWLRDAQRLQA